MSRRTRSPVARRQRQCRAKQAFSTSDHAEEMARHAWTHNKLQMGVYQCVVCRLYHLTSGGPVGHAERVQAVAGRAS